MDEVGYLHHVVFAKTACRHGWCADANAARLHNRLGVEGNCVFVYRDGCLIENQGCIGTSDSKRSKVNEEDMVVGAARNDAVAKLGESGRKGFGIVDDLLGVDSEAWVQGLLETHRLCGDDVHERAALDSWKNLSVDLLGEFFFAHDKARTRPSQAFVGGGRDKIGVGEWGGMYSASDEA